jgi:hypothetical protein
VLCVLILSQFLNKTIYHWVTGAPKKQSTGRGPISKGPPTRLGPDGYHRGNNRPSRFDRNVFWQPTQNHRYLSDSDWHITQAITAPPNEENAEAVLRIFVRSCQKTFLSKLDGLLFPYGRRGDLTLHPGLLLYIGGPSHAKKSSA